MDPSPAQPHGVTVWPQLGRCLLGHTSKVSQVLGGLVTCC